MFPYGHEPGVQEKPHKSPCWTAVRTWSGAHACSRTSTPGIGRQKGGNSMEIPSIFPWRVLFLLVLHICLKQFESVWICFEFFVEELRTFDPQTWRGYHFFSAVVAGWWGECITLHDTQCPLNLAIWSRRFGFVLATKQVTHAAQVWSLCSALNMMNFTSLHCAEGKILKKPQSQLSAPRNFCRIHADLGQLQLTSSTKPGSQGSCGHLPQGLPCWRYLDSQKSNIVKLPSRCVAYSCWAVFLFRVQID